MFWRSEICTTQSETVYDFNDGFVRINRGTKKFAFASKTRA